MGKSKELCGWCMWNVGPGNAGVGRQMDVPGRKDRQRLGTFSPFLLGQVFRQLRRAFPNLAQGGTSVSPATPSLGHLSHGIVRMD